MITRIKRTYICKDVHTHTLDQFIPENFKPVDGDVGVFEVIKIGKHKNIQSDSKRNTTIMPGDRIMAAFGTRYATEQFEGYIPEIVTGELHILGAGGTVGQIASMHSKFSNIGPTIIRLESLVRDHQGEIVNTKKIKQKHMCSFTGASAAATKVILSLGSSMDSGKTTTAAYMVHGLKKAGYKVAFIKLTGTVYTKDCDLALDLGADAVSDFGDFGFPSTYLCNMNELLDLYESCLSKVQEVNPDYVIMEIADGLYQRETNMLIKNDSFKDTIEGLVFSAGDSLAAMNGISILHREGLYPLAICGLFTTSPLLIKEVQSHTSIQVMKLNELSNGDSISNLLGSIRSASITETMI